MSYVHNVNQLARESSVYLQQHAGNPVAWQAWSPAAFDLARTANVPVLVSIGYSTCHWCHVMAHESFEDAEVAAYLNEHFVCIKVDREERPDVDAICMEVCQATTGHGGWPLTVVMDADQRPFFAGTYFPRNSTPHRIGFLELLTRIVHAWDHQRDAIGESSKRIVAALEKGTQGGHPMPVGAEVLRAAVAYHTQRYDSVHGGFSGAPKFPSAHHLLFLLRMASRNDDVELLGMVTHTLRAMRAGGMYDHVGFGFHRYSTDAQWKVPHFEKMLYDQATLMMAYTEGWQSTYDPVFKQTVYEIAEYVGRDLTGVNGTFTSAQDADTEGVEGSYYVFSSDELSGVSELLKPGAELAQLFHVDPSGNYHDEATGSATPANILYTDAERLGEVMFHSKWDTVRQSVAMYRTNRSTVMTDPKVLPDWNGLMIAALAKASRVFGDQRFLQQAEHALAGVIPRETLLDDHAMLALARVEMYQTTGVEEHLREATALLDIVRERFDYDGHLHMVSSLVSDIPVRPRMVYDGAYPSGNSIVAYVSVLLGILLHRDDFVQYSLRIIEQQGKDLHHHPSGCCQLLNAVDLHVNGWLELTVGGVRNEHELAEIHDALSKTYAPWVVVNYDTDAPAHMQVCMRDYCEQPLHELSELIERMENV